MILIFFSKKFWLCVFILFVLNYGCNQIERRSGQVAQSAKFYQASALHDVKLKVMALNSMIEELRQASTFDGPVLAECTKMRADLYKIRNEASTKSAAQLDDSLRELDVLEKKIIEMTSQINNERMREAQSHLRIANEKILASKKKYSDAEKDLEFYQTNPLLRHFLK